MKRRALFIGIDDYQHLAKLKCAVADAKAMEEFFRSVGYVTDLLVDARYPPDVTNRLREFSDGMDAGDVLLVYFAGHGIVSPEGTHKLLCADSHPNDALLGDATISLSVWKDAVRGGQDTVIIIDACQQDCVRKGIEAQKRVEEQGREIEELKRQLAELQAKGVAPRGMLGKIFGKRDLSLDLGGQSSGESAQAGDAKSSEAFAKQGRLAIFQSCQEGAFSYEANGHGIFTQALLAELCEARDSGLRVEVANGLWERVNNRMGELRVRFGIDAPQAAQLIPSLTPITILSGADDTRDAAPPAQKVENTPVGGKAFSVELPDKKFLRMRWCPATESGAWRGEHNGSDFFMMGSPTDEPCRKWLAEDDRDMAENLHSVCLTSEFWIGEVAVTQGQWKAVMGSDVEALCAEAVADDTPYEWPGSDPNRKSTFRDRKRKRLDVAGRDYGALCYNMRDDAPVYFANWNDASEFCHRLTVAEQRAGRLPKGYVYRLPTEAEWEYACRAGAETTLPNGIPFKPDANGMNATALDDIAWYAGNSFEDWEGSGEDPENYRRPQQNQALMMAQRSVYGKNANAWGIRGMLGNVWEWCLDFAGAYPLSKRQRDPHGPERGNYHIVRGGCWYSNAFECRPAARWRHEPGFRNWSVGFRIVLAKEVAQ